MEMPIKTRGQVEEDALKTLFPDASTDDKSQDKPPMDQDQFEFLWAEYEKQMNQQKAYHEAGIDIFPRAGLVMKLFVHNAQKVTKPNENNPLGIVPCPGQKTFINLCMHDDIDPPEEVMELPEHMQQQGNQEVEPGQPRLRMPLSCGPLRQCMDVNGRMCLVVDVVFNPEVLAKFDDSEYRDMVSQFALHNVQQKFGIEFKQEIKFPKARYKAGVGEDAANPVMQRIRKPKAKPVQEIGKKDPLQELNKQARQAQAQAVKNLKQNPEFQYLKHKMNQNLPPDQRIEEIPTLTTTSTSKKSTTPNTSKLSISTSTSRTLEKTTESATTLSNTPSTLCPEYFLYHQNGSDPKVPASECEFDGVPPAELVLEISLPLVSRACEMDLELSTADILLTSLKDHQDSHNYHLHFQFPFAVDDTTPRVKFVKKKKVLRVTLSVMGVLPQQEGVLQTEDKAKEEAAEVVEEVIEMEKNWRDEIPLSNKLIYRLCA